MTDDIQVGLVECPALSPWTQGQTRPVGVALEPTLVLLNHSCDPNTFRSNTIGGSRISNEISKLLLN